MAGQSVSYRLLKDRLKNGDIVTIYNPDPDWPAKRVLIKIDPNDHERLKVKCIHLEVPPVNLNLRDKWEEIIKRSTNPLSISGSGVRYISNENTYVHQDTYQYAIVKEDLLVNLMGHENAMVGKIDNEELEAERHKKLLGSNQIRIPSQQDIDEYMEEVSCTVGTQVIFDPIFANADHWVTMKRYNMSWSRQTVGVIDEVGLWKLVLAAVSDGVPGLSRFFRLFGSYPVSPLGQMTNQVINQCLPSVELFANEVIAGARSFRLTSITFRTFVATGGGIAVILGLLVWFAASLKDIVTRPRDRMITSDHELRKAYEGIDHFPVLCNMGSLVTGMIPKVFRLFMLWIRDFALKILLTIERLQPLAITHPSSSRPS